MKNKTTQEILIENLKMLMDRSGFSKPEIASKSKVSLRMINYVLSGERTPSIEVAAQLASVFGLEVWHVLMPSLPYDIWHGSNITKLIEWYIASNGNEHILHTAQREAEYGQLKKLTDASSAVDKDSPKHLMKLRKNASG